MGGMARHRWADKALVAPAVVLAVLVGVVALAPASAPPAAAATAQNLVQVGFNNLGGGGLNGEVTVVGNTALVATGINPAGGIHTHLYSPYKCEAGSVKVVNLSTPSNPTVVSTIQVPTGVSALDVAALRVDTPLFRGDLAAIAFATCGTGGGDVNRGVHYYDITNPASPVFLDYYDADADQRAPGTLPCGPARPGVSSPTGCASSQHSVSLVQRTDGRVLSLSTEPFASASNPAGCGPTAPRPPGPCPFPSGDLRIVDVTNPRDVVQVGSFPNGDDIPRASAERPAHPGVVSPTTDAARSTPATRSGRRQTATACCSRTSIWA